MAHIHSVYDTDKHFKIDPITRRITTECDKLRLMRGDHNSERYTFEIPRYIEGHDMSLSDSIEINYQNIHAGDGDPSEGPYSVDDLQISPDSDDVVIFSWLISGNSTTYAGSLSFAICFKCLTGDEIDYEWHTDVFSGITVYDGIHNDGAAVVERYADVVTRWKNDIFGVSDSEMAKLLALSQTQQNILSNQAEEILAESQRQQEAVAEKGVVTLASIPEEYTALNKSVKENTNNLRTKADAIICSTQGEQILVNDSSEDPLRGLRLFGKTTQQKTNGYQLFDASRISSIESNGVTLTNNGDGSFTVTGDGNALVASINQHYTDYELPSLLKVGLITLSAEPVVLTYMYVNFYDSDDNVVFNLVNSTGWITHEITEEELSKIVYARIGIYGTKGKTYTTGTIKPMLYQNGDGTWESYTGGIASPNPEYPQELVSVENPKVRVYGKNLVNVPDFDSVMYSNSVIYGEVVGSLPVGASIIVDYEYIGNGTPNANTNYIVGVAYEGATNTTYVHKGEPFTIEDKIIRIAIYGDVSSSATEGRFSNISVRFADTDESFESYKEIQTISPPRTLPAIPVSSGGNYTDETGQQWICDEVDFERGVYIQRILSISDFTWIQDLEKVTHYRHSDTVKLLVGSDNAPALCNVANNYVVSTSSNNIHYYINSAGSATNVYVPLGYDIEANPIEILAALATPIETPLTEAELAAYKALHTNYPTTTILNDSGMTMEVSYNADVKMFVTNLIDERIKELLSE